MRVSPASRASLSSGGGNLSANEHKTQPGEEPVPDTIEKISSSVSFPVWTSLTITETALAISILS